MKKSLYLTVLISFISVLLLTGCDLEDIGLGKSSSSGSSSEPTTTTTTSTTTTSTTTTTTTTASKKKTTTTTTKKTTTTTKSGTSNTSTKTTTTTTTAKKNYTNLVIGQEVSVKDEAFYVFKNSDSSNSSVVLFSKYNLNKAGSKQAKDASVADTKVDFSSEIYWKDVADNYTKWDSKYLDLNNVSGNKSGDAITKARNYAKSLGGSNGRLLTYEEAVSMKKNYSDMIFGHGNNHSSCKYLNYYLSSVRYYGQDRVWTIRGQGDGDISSYADNNYGVRPIITISKSLLD